jgi:hypothetical protein
MNYFKKQMITTINKETTMVNKINQMDNGKQWTHNKI